MESHDVLCNEASDLGIDGINRLLAVHLGESDDFLREGSFQLVVDGARVVSGGILLGVRAAVSEAGAADTLPAAAALASTVGGAVVTKSELVSGCGADQKGKADSDRYESLHFIAIFR